jgi:hypothetical protein
MTGENVRTGSMGSPRAWETPPGGQRPGGAGRDLGVMVRPGRNDLPVVVDTLAVARVGGAWVRLVRSPVWVPMSCVSGFALHVQVASSSVPGSP